MKIPHHEITCTERITMAPDLVRRIDEPRATEKTYPVYRIAGERYIEVWGDSHGGRRLSKLDSENLHVDIHGVLRPSRCPLRVRNEDMPYIRPADMPNLLTDITGNICI